MTGTYQAHREFRAMGTRCSILVFGQDRRIEALASLAKRRVDLLESLWSRFRADSELTRLNERSGSGGVSVSPETEGLVRAMQRGWEWTGGAFDPTVLAAVKSNGYDRDFARLIAYDFVDAVGAPAPGMADVVVGDRMVALPRGVGVDPGAIGKGLAADIIVDEMMTAGAAGVLVDLGGDIAFAGNPGAETHWRISIVDERAAVTNDQGRPEREFVVPAGVEHAGIATSTSLTRRWAQGRHHVIDPRTGRSTSEELVQVTVAGGRAWECEVWATAVLVRPHMLANIPDNLVCTALAVDEDVRDGFPTKSLEEKVA